MPEQCICIGTYVFTSVFPDPEGDIGIDCPTFICKRETQALCGIKAGCRFTPGFLTRNTYIEVIEGMGLFYLSNRTKPYYAGTRFFIPQFTPFSFIKVAKDTVYLVDSKNFAVSKN